jgi:hypothetical protein
MLFELAVARAEQILAGSEIADWEQCLSVASSRQRRHFDANIPSVLTESDIDLAETAAVNLFTMLTHISEINFGQTLKISPKISGYSWIASGNIDFSMGSILIEVKHTRANYSVSDFRQVIMYWILSYADAIENNGQEFTDCILLNPRRNSGLAFKFSMITRFASAGQGKIEILRQFESLLSDHLINP